MLRTLRSLLRFLRIARTLARHDALASLEEVGVAPGLVWFARRFSRRQAEGRPGQKLAHLDHPDAIQRSRLRHDTLPGQLRRTSRNGP